MASPLNQNFGRSLNSSTPSSTKPTGSNNYQVNVNRTKTKKWVEARVQSYDGDDWGADEYDDHDEPESPPPLPQPKAQRPVAAMPRSSFRDETEPASYSSIPRAQNYQTVTSSHEQRPTVRTPSAGSLPSATVMPSRSDIVAPARPTGNASPTATLNRQPQKTEPLPESIMPSSRPFDAARHHFSDENELKCFTIDNTRQQAEASSSVPDFIAKSGRPVNVSGARQSAAGSGGDFDAQSEDDHESRRSSASPQLPDVARMSGFGPDWFSPTTTAFSGTEPTIHEQDGDGSLKSPNVLQSKMESAKKDAAPQPETALAFTPEVPNAYDRFPKGLFSQRAWEVEDDLSEIENLQKQPLADNAGEIQPLSPIADKSSFVVTADSDIAQPQARQPITSLRSDSPAPLPLRTPSPRGLSDQFGRFPSPKEGLLSPGRKSVAAGDGTASRPAYEIADTSPVKDNDALSDEILRSLTPSASFAALPTVADGSNLLHATNSTVPKESSRGLQDCSNHETDAPGKTQTDALHDAIEAIRGTTSPPNAPSEETMPRKRQLQRKFSWEGGGDENRLSVSNPDKLLSGELVTEEIENLAAQPRSAPTPPLYEVDGASSNVQADQPRDLGTWAIPATDGAKDLPELPDLQPPSPVSPLAGGLTPLGSDGKRLSLADEKALTQTSSYRISPTPPPESHPAFAPPPPAKSDIPAGLHNDPEPGLSLREIMGLPALADKIAKLNEARSYYATNDSGLNAWLVNMQAQHPEHLGGVTPPAATSSHQASQAGSQPSSAGNPSTTQQPYYQQYLNASAPGPSTAGRSRLGSLQMHQQGTGSAFGHPTNQIGTKSKEFMHSAGKMGKGLLNKGKNKLRGSGDKGESFSCLPQANVKSERRSSWALGLGPRSRVDETAPQATLRTASEGAPLALQATQSASTPSADPRRQDQTFQWHPLAQSRSHDGTALLGRRQQQQQQQQHADRPPNSSGSATRAVAGLSKLEIPSRAFDSVWSPGTEHTPEIESDEWIVVPRDSDRDPEVSPLEPEPESGLESQDAVEQHATSIDSTRDHNVQSQVQPTKNTQQRKSSFKGLPPIRRSSTFGLKTRAKRASRRFSLVDDDEHDDIADHGPKNRASAPLISSVAGKTELLPSFAPLPALQFPGSLVNPLESSIRLVSDDTGQEHVIKRSENARLDGNLQSSKPLPGESSSQPKLSPSKPPALLSPIPGLADGPWKLEESHLSEPLHSVTRHRPEAGSSQQPLAYGFDKETGISTTQRQKSSDIPPSSANRWPGLFSQHPSYDDRTPHPDPKPWMQSDPRLHQQLSERDEYGPSKALRSEMKSAEAKSSDQSGGRDSPGLGIYKPQNPATSRSSLTERPRLSIETSGMSSEFRAGHTPVSTNATGDGPEGRPRPFSLGIGNRAHMQMRDRNSGSSRPSISDLLRDCTASDQARDEDATKKKKRFSNLVSLSGLRDMWHGHGTDRNGKAQVWLANRSDASRDHQYHPGQASPHSSGNTGTSRRDRASTQTAGLPEPYPHVNSGRDDKRASISGMISNFLGNKPANRLEGHQGPRHVQSSADLQAQHRQGTPDPQLMEHARLPGSPSREPLRPFSAGMGRTRAASFDIPRPLSQLSGRRMAQSPGTHPKPSPLRLGAPMTHEVTSADSDRQRLDRDLEASPTKLVEAEHRRNASAPLLLSRNSVPGAAGPEASLPLAGIGAQHVAAGEAALMRTSTVSPDLSITSATQDHEQAVQGSNSFRQRLIGASAHPVSDIGLNGAGSRAALTCQHRPSLVSSLDASEPRQLQQSSNFQPGALAQDVMPRSSHFRPRPSIGDRLSTDAVPRQASPSPSTRCLQDDLPRTSFAHEVRQQPQQPPAASTNFRTADPEQSHGPQFSYFHSNLPTSLVNPTAGQKGLQTSNGASYGSRWQGLKARVTGQIAPEGVNGQGGIVKGEKKAGSRLFGALKRMSRQLEPAHGQWGRVKQKPAHKPELAFPGRLTPEQFKMTPDVLPIRMSGASQHPQPFPYSGTTSPLRAVSPQAGHGGTSPVQPFTMKQRSFVSDQHSEPLYDQVPIPRGYRAVHGEGVAAHAPYSAESRMSAGENAARPLESRAPQLSSLASPSIESPEKGHKTPAQHASVSSFGMIPSPPMGSMLDARAGAGKNGLVAYQPSIVSVSSWRDSGVDEGEGRGTPLSDQSRGKPRSPHSLAGSPLIDSVGLACKSPSPVVSGVEPFADAAESPVTKGTPPEPSVYGASPDKNDGQVKNADKTRQAKGKVVPKSAGILAPAELDDTADKYARSRRLESQEEKIFVRPEDAEDYQPQMSATSYPGQEWNPYGESGFSEWRE